MKQRPGFMLYFELVGALSSMEDADAGKLLKALMAYAQYGEVQELTGLAAFAFEVVRPRIDRDNEVYQEKCRKNAYYSYVSAAKRRGETPVEYEEWCGDERTVWDPTQPNTTQPNSNTNHSCNAAATAAESADIPSVDYGEFSFSPVVRGRVEEWLRYKAERRERYTPTGLRSLLSQLKSRIDRHGEAAVLALMGECMAAGYRGIVFDRLDKRGGKQSAASSEDDLAWMKPYTEQRDRRLQKMRKTAEGG